MMNFLQERELKKIKSKSKSKQRREAQKAERAKHAAAQLLVIQANAVVSTGSSQGCGGSLKRDHTTN